MPTLITHIAIFSNFVDKKIQKFRKFESHENYQPYGTLIIEDMTVALSTC